MDKRRKARVQGGWAQNPKSSALQRENRDTTRSSSVDVYQQVSSKLFKDAVTTELVSSGSLLAEATTAFQPSKFTFSTDAVSLKKEPVNKTIDEPGSYILSSEPSGISSIQLIHNFIERSECDWIFEQIHQEVPWKQQASTKADQTYLQPRLTAWFGEHPYSYSGVSHQENFSWTPTIQMLKDRIEEVTGYVFNSVLANLYRDGHDHLSWHSDDEVSLGVQPIIASLSFGDSRNFELRKKPPQSVVDPDDSNYSEYLKIPLDAGSLLIMEGFLQQDWQHRIPKEYHDRGPRMNLTYRTILPP